MLAAASLTEAFTTLGKQFEAAHPGVTVQVQLRRELGARRRRSPRARRPTCSPPPRRRTWSTVVKAGDAHRPRPDFVKNTMEIAVPPSNPASVDDRRRPGQAGREGRAVPAAGAVRGRGRQVFKNARITVTPVTLRARREVDADQGRDRRGGRGRGVRDRRAGGRHQGQGGHHPRQRERLHRVPDRHAQQQRANTAIAQAFVAYVLSLGRPAGARRRTASRRPDRQSASMAGRARASRRTTRTSRRAAPGGGPRSGPVP